MRNIVYLDKKNKKYKGNTHLHTKWSDGKLDAEEVVERYKDLGYHFLCFSDHEIYTRTNEFDTETFITIPGMERGGLNPAFTTNDNIGFHFTVLDDPNIMVPERYYHLQQFEYPQKWEGDLSVTQCIRRLEEHGNLVILNHPEWHMTAFEVMKQYDFFAVEIYNHATEWSLSTSYGTAYWDYALQNGKRLFAIAADDSHDYNKDKKILEYGGGWIVVDSDKLTHRELMKNIKEGNYYSSSGPEIYDFRVEDGKVKIQCSQVQAIMFKSWPVRGDFIIDRDGSPLTGATLKINPLMTYVRVECIDCNGKTAWTNPIFIKDLL
ncbi:PHP domain-containing protein [Anaerocolumna sp. MB42-C2]|uniref:PHP domain-containing protein n=1 Tax=Anaerocolumna sp. MB42-C2 TaxID=3070997 RepID=UPI0027DFD17B|nr:hypothetical protein [Anaerocolumna sp. MB42-C2]WMJ90269.1 hypothetical protein RBU59_12280 [Anaerocolumna sp. MB42-C2]